MTAAIAESVDRALDDVAFVPAGAAQECLVADARATLTPADMVERKLMSLLKDHALAISHVQMLTTGRSRGR